MARKHHRFVEDAAPVDITPTPISASVDQQVSCFVRNCSQPPSLYVFAADARICEQHADAIWERVEWRDARDRDQDVPGMEGRDYIRGDARKVKAVERQKPTSVGEIYFVRIDDLIKVGWTSKLADRIRAYGPKAELLTNYPGTRADESALHRQLTPSRFRGREWYSDTDIIRAFIAEAITKHGRPRFERIEWTEPKTSNVKPKRWSA